MTSQLKHDKYRAKVNQKFVYAFMRKFYFKINSYDKRIVSEGLKLVEEQFTAIISL
jgi:hypothetical protein